MFTDDLKLALAAARSEAHRLHHDHVRPAHLALGVLRTAPTAITRLLADAPPDVVAAELERSLAPDRRTPEDRFDIPYTPSAKAVIERAMVEAHALGTDQVACEHLLFGVLGSPDALARQPFVARGLDAGRVHEFLAGPRDRGEQPGR